MQVEHLRSIEGQFWKELGAVLRKRREDLGLTQDRAAEGIPISPDTLRHYEHGARRPSLDCLAAWATTLGLSEKELLDIAITSLIKADHAAKATKGGSQKKGR